MIECGCGARLSTEPLERDQVLRQIVWQEFQCNRAVQASVDRFVDNAHSPGAQFFHDPKVRNRLANHRRTALWQAEFHFTTCCLDLRLHLCAAQYLEVSEWPARSKLVRPARTC